MRGGRCAIAGVSRTSTLVEDPVGLRRDLLGLLQCEVDDPRRHPRAEAVGLPGAPLQPLVVLHRIRLGPDAGEELRDERGRRVGVARVDLPDVVAEVGQQPRRCPRPRGRAIGSGRTPRITGLTDQPIRSRPGSRCAASVNDPVSSCLEPVGRQVAADRVVHQRAVQHAAGERPGRAEREPEVLHRRGGDPAALRLEAEQPAAGARDADRATAVAAHPGRHHAARRPRPPYPRWSRPACGWCPTGCG